jgi:hypothetical protein
MRFRLPKYPSGTSSEAIAIRYILDFLKSLVPIRTRGSRFDRTTRGTVHRINPGGGTGDEALFPEIPEWNTELDFAEGDLTVRSNGVKGPGPWNPNDSISTGRQTGMWVATEDIQNGSDAEGPSLDNPKWRVVAPHATEQLVMSIDGKGLIRLDVGRDGDARPSITISDADVADGGSGGQIRLSAASALGRSIDFRWVHFCLDGVKKRALFFMSEPENIPDE